MSHISEVISQSVAPAFILGAVSGFTSVLVTRLNRIIDRCRTLAAGDQNQGGEGSGGAELSALNARAKFINLAIFLALGAALATILLMVVAFADAFLEIPHEKGVAILFVVALLLFGAALFNFGREVQIALRDPNSFD
jgi:Protein of unknown function (DUF2721)